MTTAVRWAIRPATPDDATVVADLGARTFRQTYADETNDADIEVYLASAYRAEDLGREMADSHHHWFVAELDGAPIGFAHLRDDQRHEDITATRPVLLAHLYLDRSAQGLGLGAALMETCLDAARDAEYDAIWLGVWERNEQAIGFYRRFGFFAVGEMRFTMGTDEQRDIVMARRA